MTVANDGTSLKLRGSGFPTASIFKHLKFYWGGTLEILKQHVERRRKWREQLISREGLPHAEGGA